MSSKFGHSKKPPFVFKSYVCNTVIGLFSAGSPTAITRFIITSIINTFDGVIIFQGAFTHIFKKIFKTAFFFVTNTPTIAQSYFTFFVISKSWVTWLRTTCNHVLPRTISRATFSMPCMPMGSLVSTAAPDSAVICHTAEFTLVRGLRQVKGGGNYGEN